jgi:hypothetical protein
MLTGKSFLLAIVFVLLSPFAQAQKSSLYTYQNLSHLHYERQKDSIKKAWTCPVIYKEKATQKKYREYWDERTDFVTGIIADDNYVYDEDLYQYIDNIISQLVKANQQLLPVKPLLLIDRSPSANAYAIGGNLFAINLGLITFVRTREELALVIAHELSHNILAHAENAMKQKAEWFSSDEYKNSVNAVLDSKYERLSRLKRVFEGFSFNRSKHQRYHESDADSLAIVLLKSSNIPFDPVSFLRLDSADIQYRQPLKNELQSYFTAYQLPYEASWSQKRSKGLSTRNYNFRDTSSLQDSLKTHPDCVTRYTQTLHAATPGATYTPLPVALKEKAMKMQLWNMYCNMNLTPCLYRILLEKDKGNTDEWYDFMVYNIFTGLFYADKELHRFSAIGVIPKEYTSKDYYALQTLLEQMPRESMEQYCKTLLGAGFWNKMSRNETGMKNFMHMLALEPPRTDKENAQAAKEFAVGYPSSMYREFVTPFETKK